MVRNLVKKYSTAFTAGQKRKLGKMQAREYIACVEYLVNTTPFRSVHEIPPNSIPDVQQLPKFVTQRERNTPRCTHQQLWHWIMYNIKKVMKPTKAIAPEY